MPGQPRVAGAAPRPPRRSLMPFRRLPGPAHPAGSAAAPDRGRGASAGGRGLGGLVPSCLLGGPCPAGPERGAGPRRGPAPCPWTLGTAERRRVRRCPRVRPHRGAGLRCSVPRQRHPRRAGGPRHGPAARKGGKREREGTKPVRKQLRTAGRTALALRGGLPWLRCCRQLSNGVSGGLVLQFS